MSPLYSGWEFAGIDPSAEMLRLAEATTERFAARIRLHEGYVDSAPAGPFDAAGCLLTLHSSRPLSGSTRCGTCVVA